jgi:NAD(P)H-nitrite reductase large subunit
MLSVGLIPENELSREMGVDINPVTNGPRVNESLETSVEGVFACGNVLHVHDLVDYATLEAQNAGRNAAEYVNKYNDNSSKAVDGAEINIIAKNGIRYTVPEKININRMDESVIVRFRVTDIFKNAYVVVFLDGERIIRKKRLIMVPSEMEEIRLEKAKLAAHDQLRTVTIEVEKE